MQDGGGLGNIGRLVDAYTAQSASKKSAFVIFGGRTASKDRNTLSDGIQAMTAGDIRNQRILQNMAIFTFATITDQKSNGVQATDSAAEDVAIFIRSLVGLRVDTTFTCKKSLGSLVYTGDDTFSNDGVVYIHEFDFQNQIETGTDDTFISTDNRAFRRINQKTFFSVGDFYDDTYPIDFTVEET